MKRYALLLAATLATGAGLIGAPAADAAPLSTVTLAASATGPTSGAATATKAVVTVTITVSGAPADAATLSADEVPGRVTGVDVDRSPAPAGTYDTIVEQNPERTRTLVRLGDGANSTVPGTLSVGKHTVAITTDLGNRSAGPLRVTSTVDYLNGQAPSPSATATIPLPDLVVTAPTDPRVNDSLTLGPGGEAFFFAEVKNRGAAVKASTLTITLPPGLELNPRNGVIRFDDNDGDEPLTCTRASATVVTCPFGAVSGEVDVALDLHAGAAAKPGTNGTLAINVEADNGLDATPADNTSRSTVRFVPPSRLRTTLKADDTSVEVGSKAHITATVTNEGTEPVAVFGVVAIGNKIFADDEKTKQHFTITGFTGRQGLPKGEEGGSGGEGDPVPAARGLTSFVTVGGSSAGGFRAMARQAASKDDEDDPTDDPNVRFWNIGTLAPGASAKAVLTVRAKSVGRGASVALASPTTETSTCIENAEDEKAARRCPEVGYVQLRAVAGASTNGDGTLAATGVPTTQLTVLGCALLLLGGLSLYAGSPRSRIVGRHRT